MRTTLNLNDALMKQAIEATGLKTKTEVIELGLRRLVEQAAAQRVIAMAGKIPDAWAAPRRRPRR
jgi:Arc/MetJ family transcription regulator